MVLAALALTFNDKGCAFGGSLASYHHPRQLGLVVLRLRAAGVATGGVRAGLAVATRAPVWSDFRAEARAAEASPGTSSFIALGARGRAPAHHAVVSGADTRHHTGRASWRCAKAGWGSYCATAAASPRCVPPAWAAAQSGLLSRRRPMSRPDCLYPCSCSAGAALAVKPQKELQPTLLSTPPPCAGAASSETRPSSIPTCSSSIR